MTESRSSRQLRRDTSAFLFALAVTVILCAFAAGVSAVDRSANRTVKAAGGLLYPAEEELSITHFGRDVNLPLVANMHLLDGDDPALNEVAKSAS